MSKNEEPEIKPLILWLVDDCSTSCPKSASLCSMFNGIGDKCILVTESSCAIASPEMSLWATVLKNLHLCGYKMLNLKDTNCIHFFL